MLNRSLRHEDLPDLPVLMNVRSLQLFITKAFTALAVICEVPDLSQVVGDTNTFPVRFAIVDLPQTTRSLLIGIGGRVCMANTAPDVDERFPYARTFISSSFVQFGSTCIVAGVCEVDWVCVILLREQLPLIADAMIFCVCAVYTFGVKLTLSMVSVPLLACICIASPPHHTFSIRIPENAD